jgi:hypothetical protein
LIQRSILILVRSYISYPITLLHREKYSTGGYLPYLIFNVLVQSNIFSVHQYKREFLERENIRNKVWELHKEGWGFTKIHRYLKSNGFEKILQITKPNSLYIFIIYSHQKKVYF